MILFSVSFEFREEKATTSFKMAHIKDSHIAKTEWPDTPIPDAAKRLIDRFLDIMDHNTEDAGDKLATEIFTPDGVLSTSAFVARGEAGWLHFQLILLI
jgi:hypothetical protein